MTISDVAAERAPVSDIAATRRRVSADHTPEQRSARTRHYAMTPPTFFAVEYAINPWMDISTPVELLATMITSVNPAVLVRDFKTDKTFIITRSDVIRVLC